MKTTEDLARDAGMGAVTWRYQSRELERFAALVRAQALEEAAQILDRMAYDESDDFTHNEEKRAAAAIRALAGPREIPPGLVLEDGPLPARPKLPQG